VRQSVASALALDRPRVSILQVAVCCSVLRLLQCVAVFYSVLQHIAIARQTTRLHSAGCSALQCVVACCSFLQRVAACCSALQRFSVCCSVLQCVAVCCSVLQCVAACCSILQCVAACCYRSTDHRSLFCRYGDKKELYIKRAIYFCKRALCLRKAELYMYHTYGHESLSYR